MQNDHTTSISVGSTGFSYNVLDLFSGIGGFSLGLERAGMRTTAFCEIEPYCRKVLAQHWPETPIHEDIRHLDGSQYAGRVDVICGGFPCQDISVAGRGAGLGGERSGLWREYNRLIRQIRPRYIIVENVAALLSRGMGDVLADLASCGYDAEWRCIPAAAVGSPRSRDRVWIVAYPQREGLPRSILNWEGICKPERHQPSLATESYLAGFDGIPMRMGRHTVKAYGNAVVPQIPELIGRSIIAYEHALAA